MVVAVHAAVVLVVASTSTVAPLPTLQDATLAAVLADLQAQHDLLLKETAVAEARGVPVYYERATLALAEYFARVAVSDNTTSSQTILRSQYKAFYTRAPIGFADALAAVLPVREANDTVQLLQRARTSLAVAVNTTGRRPLPSRSLIDGDICDGYFCNAEGIPVFSAGFNTWLAHKDPPEAPFDPVATGVTQETVGFLIKRGLQANFTWDSATIADVKQQLDTAASINQTVFALMSQAMPEWAEAMYPGLNTGNFTSHGVSFDIDNPGAAVVSTAGIHAWLDAVGCHPAFGGWILANEPDFPVSNTPHTMAKYRGWLQQRYGTTSALNKAWGSDFSSFGDIASQPANPGNEPSDPLLVGGPAAEWWDWNVFNNARVTDFFAMLRNAIHSWDPKGRPVTARCMATTIKLQDGNEFAGRKGVGINRTALVALQSINGNDMWISPIAAVDDRNRPTAQGKPSSYPRNYDLAHYSIDWVTLAAGYALQKSANWSKPVFNTEWHGASTLKWRDEHETPEYITAAVWTGLFFGEAMNVAWFFPRQGPETITGSFTNSFAGSFATQPVATDAFLRAFMGATAHSGCVAAIGRVRPRVWLLRSWGSFAISVNTTSDLLGAFEPASFLGPTVGFLFEEQLEVVGSGDVVLVAGSTHVADTTVDWLRSRVSSMPGTVAAVVNPNATAAGAQLMYTSSGVPRAPAAIAFLSNVPRIELSSARGALAQMAAMPAMAAIVKTLPARCADADVDVNTNVFGSASAFGVLCKFAVHDGRTRGLAVNLRATVANVIVQPGDAGSSTGIFTAINVLTGVQQVLRSGRTLSLQSSEVVLLDLGPAQGSK